MSRTKTWKNNPWTIGIGTTVLGFILLVLRDINKENPIFTTFEEGIHTIFRLAIKFFTTDIEIWVIIITLLLLFIIRYTIKSLKTRPINVVFDFKSYVKDNFKEFNWHWKWKFDPISDHYVADGIYPECKQCNTRLLVKDHYQCYYCPRCEKEYENLSVNILKDIEGLIIDNLDKKKSQFERMQS